MSDAAGRRASSIDLRAVTTLVKRYYKAAADGDSAVACSLLAPTLARELTEGEAQSARGGSNGCITVLTALLKQEHGLLTADEVATMSIIALRIKGAIGTATIGFRKMPVGKIHVKREHGRWGIDELLGRDLT